jgi:septal ring factor EnvC (AmiA/AmiB activator)
MPNPTKSPAYIRYGGGFYVKSGPDDDDTEFTYEDLETPGPKATTKRKTKLQQEVAALEKQVDELTDRTAYLEREREEHERAVETLAARSKRMAVEIQDQQEVLTELKDEIFQLAVARDNLRREVGLKPAAETQPVEEAPAKRWRAAKSAPTTKGKGGRKAKAAPFVDSPYIVDIETSKS